MGIGDWGLGIGIGDWLDKIYEGLGYTVSINEKGEKENIKYTKSPRAKIFDRDQSKINSIEEFKKFMRYNDYKNDNYSENNPSNAIAVDINHVMVPLMLNLFR